MHLGDSSSRRGIPFVHKGERMSKKRSRNRECNYSGYTSPHFELKSVSPLTVNQELTFDAYKRQQNLILHGYAGTGKSYITMYLALKEVLSESTPFKKIITFRNVVPSRDMGFLPGSIKDKTRVYEEPYKEICDDLFGRGDGFDILKMKGFFEFTTTSHLRGLTFNDSIMIVDEMQNMTFQELDTIMTRVGNNSKIIFCGDFRQTDLIKDSEKSGINKFISITKRMKNFEYIEFEEQDIVRSGLVKDYIIQRTRMNISC